LWLAGQPHEEVQLQLTLVAMQSPHDLLLITGIPGTGKTWYGDQFANQFGFLHYDLEEQSTLHLLGANPAQFIAELASRNENVVVTWGFVPDATQTAIVFQFRDAGFKVVWFDGNRPAALREFRKRNTVPEELFYAQMYRIENSRIIAQLKPIIINSFDDEGRFKLASELLSEMKRS
jgi:adenylate kinase family enzyme